MNQDTQSSISDDQELAKVLAGINPDEPQEFDIQMNSPAPTQKTNWSVGHYRRIEGGDYVKKRIKEYISTNSTSRWRSAW